MYVITGASGHTGTVAARTLLVRGHSVRVVGRNAEHLRPSLQRAQNNSYAISLIPAV